MLWEHVATRFPRVRSPFMWKKIFVPATHCKEFSWFDFSRASWRKNINDGLDLQCRITALANCTHYNIEMNQYPLHVQQVAYCFCKIGAMRRTNDGACPPLRPHKCVPTFNRFSILIRLPETTARINVFWSHSRELLHEHVSLPVLVFQHFCSFCFKQFLQVLFPEI